MKTLKNRKTGKTFRTPDSEGVMKKYPRTFIEVRNVERNKEILEVDSEIIAELFTRTDLINKTRKELDAIAKNKGLDPKKFSNKKLIIDEIIKHK